MTNKELTAEQDNHLSLQEWQAAIKIKKLVFNNADAKPKTIVIECLDQSVAPIMAWYGAYYSGDRYTVTYDGRNIPMDVNGEPK